MVANYSIDKTLRGGTPYLLSMGFRVRGRCPCDPGIYRFRGRLGEGTERGYTRSEPTLRSTLGLHPCIALSFGEALLA